MSDINITVQDEIVNIDILDEPVLVNVVNSPGVPGAPGVGVPVGGTTGQVLAKNSNTNYDTEWVDVSGGTWGSITGTLSDQTDLQSALDAKVPYTGATQDVSLGEYGINVGNVIYDTTPTGIPTDQGATYWDDQAETVALVMNGTIQKIGEDTFYHVKNSTGSTIAKGVAVRFAGTDGGSGKILIAPFLANGTYPTQYYMGITAEAITNGSNGKVYHFGKIRGVNTSAFADGDILYCSTTVAGGFQTTAPSAPNNIVIAAAVINAANNGTLMVRTTTGSNINTDEGVLLTTPTSGQVLKYNGSLWVNDSVSGALGYTPANAATTLTINGVTYDLSANRTFSVGSVTGSGASGQVAYWTGTSAQSGDTGLTWDSTNKRLTINTSGQGRTISTYYASGTDGFNIWVGGGGTNSSGTSASGSYNTSFGVNSLNANTTGYYNSGFGYNSLNLNTTGVGNMGFGAFALLNNISGFYNTSIGALSLYSNTNGNDNIGIGYRAGYGTGTNPNTTGSNNIFIGKESVGVSSSESNRTWIGNSLTTSTWLAGNLHLGSTSNSGERLQVTGTMKVTGASTIIGDNTTSATYALTLRNSTPATLIQFRNDGRINQNLISASDSTAFGTNALNVSTGSSNSAFGGGAMSAATIAVDNAAFGRNSLSTLTTGSRNATFGAFSALGVNGSNIVAIGESAARYYAGGTTSATSFSNGVYIGRLTKVSAASATNEIVIGYEAEGIGSNTTVIGNTSMTTAYIRGKLMVDAATTARASINIGTGTAPTTPNDGDIWFDGTDIKMRIGGVTKTFTLV